MDSAQNPMQLTPNGDPYAALYQKEIYPVKDSHSYITPYTQRDHAWNDAQHDVSDEVKWSKETNTTAADHIHWLVNEQGPHSRLYPGTPAAALSQNEWTQFKPVQSKISAWDQRDSAWTDEQHDKSNIDEWKAHIDAVGADYMDSAQNPLELPAALSQKEIYPVKDSHSYISPYTQRDHAWNDAQHDVSDEVKWSKETNTTAADHLDWVVNEQGPHSRLYPGTPAAALSQNGWVQFKPVQSKISAWDQRDSAWTDEQNDKSNEDEWKAHIQAVGADYMDSAQNPLVLPAALSQKEIYPVKDSHSYITPYTQRDHAWNDDQHNVSDEVKWSKETNTTAADHIHWLVNEQGPYSRLYPGTPTPAAPAAGAAALSQKEIYPVKDSHSYITPYTQRDHAWNDDQHDVSDEVKWSKETNVTAADHLDWVVNEQGAHSRLYPAAALVQQENGWVQFKPVQSKIAAYDQRNDAWSDAQADATNEDDWKALIQAVGADYLDSAVTAKEAIVPNADKVASLV